MIDCNNFYASCERVFDPRLIGKPIAILSNNDGCVIARSEEAKDVGVEMGAPEFKYRNHFRENGMVVRSSNYALYGDMSHRVMETLRYLTHDIEVYSIDEAFAELSTNVFPDLVEYGKMIRETILKWTGLPVSVGIASTKTLAKVANHIAKKNPEYNGVFDFTSAKNQDALLADFPVNKIWGIGQGLTIRLNRFGITNALELKRSIGNKKWVRKQMAVTGLRTVLELNGKSCSGLSVGRDSRKGILSSRMFGKPLYDLESIQEALATFTTRATEKLRAQDSVASCIQIQLIGDKYDNIRGKYKFSAYCPLQVPTAHTPTMIQVAKKLAEKVYEPGRKYKKASVMLTGIIPQTEVQMDLFDPEMYTQKQHRLMECLDQINAKFGRNHAAFAATGLHKEIDHRNKWLMNQNYLSKRYTTRWDELMVVKAGD
ncbi:MAG: Y-family DNA polymerase [Balneolaceae bacterium]|nr:Y-family DNA polymerase [Balneolaceae bacterium]